MDEDRARSSVKRRITQMLQLTGRIEQTLDEQREHVQGHAQVAAVLEYLANTTRGWREALERVGTAPEEPQATATTSGTAPSGVLAMLQADIAAFSEAAVGYAALYTTARLMYDGETADLAAAHLRTCAALIEALNRLVPDVTVQEVEAEGLGCRCACPSCALGACLCARNSIDTIAAAWGAAPPFGTSGLEPGDVESVIQAWSVPETATTRGVMLHVTPRAGTAVASAGIERGHRILAVAGQPVRTNGEMQAAVRGRAPGKPLELLIERAPGESEAVSVMSRDA